MSQTFEQALVAKLNTITALTGIVGNAIYKTFVPQTYLFDRNGPALTYSIISKPYGHMLTGSDGTATARVQIDVWAFSAIAVKQGIEAVRNMLDGAGLDQQWGDGSVVIMSCIQQDDVDLDEAPEAGSDQVTYHSLTEYSVKYRVSIPTLS
jgi:hypothetical protein